LAVSFRLTPRSFLFRFSIPVRVRAANFNASSRVDTTSNSAAHKEGLPGLPTGLYIQETVDYSEIMLTFHPIHITMTRGLIIPRKEVIQPQVPLRLPCYDLAPVTELTIGRRLLIKS
jgi:hypothetical protein